MVTWNYNWIIIIIISHKKLYNCVQINDYS